MANNDKTEAPTPKRKREARRKGQIARSQDLVVWSQMLVATFAIGASVSVASTSLQRTMQQVRVLTETPDVNRAIHLMVTALGGGLLAIGPLAGGLILTTIVTTFAQTGMAVSAHKIKPSTQKINPMKGIKRLLSKQGAWEATKELARASILAWVAWQPLTQVTGQLVSSRAPMRTTIGIVGSACLRLGRNVAFAGIGLSLIDFVVQKRRIMKSLKMTKQEVKDEFKQSEGDPQVKNKRRQMALDMARNRMLSDVRTASAVVVNPTHVAVAIRYERSHGAPRVIAKGTGMLATKIREEAERNGVPIVRDVLLARALNIVCEVGSEIPADMYEAVARLLAFVMSVGKKASWAGPLTMRGPSMIPPHIVAQVGDLSADPKRGTRRVPKRRANGRRPSNEVS